MKNFVFLALAAILLTIGQFSSAKITQDQINTLKAVFPNKVDEKLVQDFVDNYDALRSWVTDDIMAPVRAPGPVMADLAEPTIPCDICIIGVGTVISLIRNIADSLTCIKLSLKIVCNLLLTTDVCNGAIDTYAEPLAFIFQNRTDTTAYDVCGMYLGIDGNCPPIREELRNWTIELPPGKPAITNPPLLPENHPSVKFLQLTDIHPDLHYMVGSNGTCGKPMCCRDGDESTDAGAIGDAGYHGHYQCDMPEHAMLDVFQNAKERYNDYKFILMTGDLVHHSVWSTTKEDNIEHFNSVNFDLISRFAGIPIYPVIGNHESHPCNMYPPRSIWGYSEEFNNSWVYGTIADTYKESFIGQGLAEGDLRRAGYYMVKPPGTQKLRLIILNTNFCYNNNFWLFYEAVDVEGHLDWLNTQLFIAELAGDKVFLVGHIPPGKSDCWSVWNHQFQRIVNRFEGTIQAQFYGHTHNDETTIFFDSSSNPPRPMNTLNIGVSVTPYTKLNPGYKVYYADGATATPTWELMNHETFVYNLSLANSQEPIGRPLWYKLYDMKSAFQLSSLRPAHLYEVVEKMVNDPDLFHQYWRFYHKDSHLATPCEDEECRMNYLCEVVRADSSDNSHCERLKQLLPIPSTTSAPI
jgi:sphingomyelin phosphodiesterase